MRKFSLLLYSFFILSIFFSGCAINFYKGHPQDKVQIEQLKEEVQNLEKLRQQERQELLAAKNELAEKLRKEIEGKYVGLELAEKGLVITFMAEILFDSGKAKLRTESYPALDKVAKVIKTKLSDRDIGIEGHTDNEPIKYSGWKSNWELSTSRAASVLHYLEKQGIDPNKLSAIGYGEYRPVSSNDTKENRRKNRRVEIVILPKIYKDKPEGEKMEASQEIGSVSIK